VCTNKDGGEVPILKFLSSDCYLQDISLLLIREEREREKSKNDLVSQESFTLQTIPVNDDTFSVVCEQRTMVASYPCEQFSLLVVAMKRCPN
jgi:hypothetical protein